MQEVPFAFVWPVDEAGYQFVQVDPESGDPNKAGSNVLVRRGGPLRYYHPLDDESLWVRFAENCRDSASALQFANEYGRLGRSSEGPDNQLDHILETAAGLREIRGHLQVGDRKAATLCFSKSGLPTMKQVILWYANEPERFRYRLLPLSLRDALLHQAGEAITGNRRFRRCRNEGCSNWFRLGPQASDAGRARTITARREFCSDRCRVASARRREKEASPHA